MSIRNKNNSSIRTLCADPTQLKNPAGEASSFNLFVLKVPNNSVENGDAISREVRRSPDAPINVITQELHIRAILIDTHDIYCSCFAKIFLTRH